MAKESRGVPAPVDPDRPHEKMSRLHRNFRFVAVNTCGCISTVVCTARVVYSNDPAEEAGRIEAVLARTGAGWHEPMIARVATMIELAAMFLIVNVARVP